MQLTPFEKQDFENLYNFMRPLWLETYADILPKTQILFLLEKYFTPTAIARYLAQGYQYRKIDAIGVLVFIERETEIYIDKLYLSPAARGKNYPAQVFEQLQKTGKALTLNVNQRNTRAVRCYLKNGFQIIANEDIDLGDGMINRDHIIRKNAP